MLIFVFFPLKRASLSRTCLTQHSGFPNKKRTFDKSHAFQAGKHKRNKTWWKAVLTLRGLLFLFLLRAVFVGFQGILSEGFPSSQPQAGSKMFQVFVQLEALGVISSRSCHGRGLRGGWGCTWVSTMVSFFSDSPQFMVVVGKHFAFLLIAI